MMIETQTTKGNGRGKAMKGTALKAITVQTMEMLPNGVKVAMVQVTSAKDYLRLPKAVQIDGQAYGKTGWNSDQMVAYFRTDATLAF